LQDLTPRAKDNLVSFGERMSTRIFASYLRTMVGAPLHWSQCVCGHLPFTKIWQACPQNLLFDYLLVHE